MYPVLKQGYAARSVIVSKKRIERVGWRQTDAPTRMDNAAQTSVLQVGGKYITPPSLVTRRRYRKAVQIVM